MGDTVRYKGYIGDTMRYKSYKADTLSIIWIGLNGIIVTDQIKMITCDFFPAPCTTKQVWVLDNYEGYCTS
jgi:hypothetical protein